MLALGGALGGIFVGLIAPLVFNSFLELPISLLATVVLVSLTVSPWLTDAAMARSHSSDRWRRGSPRTHLAFDREPHPLVEGPTAGGPQFLWPTPGQAMWPAQRMNPRIATCCTAPSGTAHNTAIRSSATTPTLYYVPTSGVGRAILDRQKTGPIRAGLIGLGSGDTGGIWPLRGRAALLRYQSTGRNHCAHAVHLPAGLSVQMDRRSGRRPAVAGKRRSAAATTCWRWMHFQATRFRFTC